jgi:hypothetical protein
MKNSAKMRGGPNKIIIIAFLPIIIFTWMTAWILTLIGRKMDFQKTNQKSLETHHKLKAHTKKPEKSDEESRTNELIIVA